MPGVRKYASNAERQAAYRRRCADQRDVDLESGGLPSIPVAPGQRRWKMMMRQALCLVESVQSEMAAYYDGRSEGWQDSERGEAFLEMMESIEEVVEVLREVRH